MTTKRFSIVCWPSTCKASKPTAYVCDEHAGREKTSDQASANPPESINKIMPSPVVSSATAEGNGGVVHKSAEEVAAAAKAGGGSGGYALPRHIQAEGNVEQGSSVPSLPGASVFPGLETAESVSAKGVQITLKAFLGQGQPRKMVISQLHRLTLLP